MQRRSTANKQSDKNARTIARNRRASYDFQLGDTIEAGLVLKGSEVKALRNGHASLNGAWIGERKGELYLFSTRIGEYAPANRFGHEPNQPRKLLVHHRERQRLRKDVARRGMTLVPLSLYFNKRGLVKISLAPGQARKLHDRRQNIKNRDWKRRQQRLLSHNEKK
ncbi:MAG: SsrA-binding protein SmpB [Alphaproteobacteria bacterium]